MVAAGAYGREREHEGVRSGRNRGGRRGYMAASAHLRRGSDRRRRSDNEAGDLLVQRRRRGGRGRRRRCGSRCRKGNGALDCCCCFAGARTRGAASADRLRERKGEEEGFMGIGRRSRVGQAWKQRRDFGSGRIPMRRRQEEWRRSGGSLEIMDLSDLGRGWTIYIYIYGKEGSWIIRSKSNGRE